MSLPKKYKHQEVEQKWSQAWEDSQVYQWNPNIEREHTFVVDTPPPTVSGSLHVGHVFSYTHTDLVVRYQRMNGKNIMYPMGWDDNGLPTERRVQNKYGINCVPQVAYDPNWQPKEVVTKKGKCIEPQEVSRENFIEACNILTEEDEKAFEELWRALGLSVDWNQQYATIDPHCRKVSQASFLDLVDKNLVYTAESPTMWDVGFQTALAQADIEDRERPGAYHDIRFGIEGEGDDFIISTTRPELLVACIAVVAHPDDERYQAYFGKNAITPLFKASVPIIASEHADPEKGSGIMMVCTFGDAADVDWWKASNLPIKQALNRKGCFSEIEFTQEPFISLEPEFAARNYAEIVGKGTSQARRRIAEMLAEPDSSVDGTQSALVGEPKQIVHPVKFYEKGDRPIEFITTRQWFISILDHKEELLKQGEKIDWHPAHMRTRYDNWVSGLNYDWCISRQRFFGVPFPVWYPIDASGEVDYQNPIFASAEALPVDPMSASAPGFSEEQRGQAGGFAADPDVMDTWATSSLTPQIVTQWSIDDERHQKLFPMDMRPQSHEIIRTWAFYTIVKAWMHEKEIPWRNVVISGWILDPDRKKMSKSKGNVVTPQHLLEEYSSDAVRYWASRARLGVDTAFDEKVFASGRKLATKIFNASKFVISQIQQFSDDGLNAQSKVITEEIDRALVAKISALIEETTKAYQRFDYAQALQLSETAFWNFCDHYVELVKARAYSAEDVSERGSAVATLEWTIKVFLRLFAPVMPFVTEEVWSWHFAEQGKPISSIHKASWPTLSEVAEVSKPEHDLSLEAASEVLGVIHHAKSKAQKSLKWPLSALHVSGESESIESLKLVIGDIVRAGRLEGETQFSPGKPEEGKIFSIELTLSETAD